MENLYSLISVWCTKNETEKQKKNALQVNLGHFIKTCATTKTLKDKLLAAGTCWVIMEWMFWYYSCYCKNYVSSAFQHRENMSYETFFLLSVSQFVSQVYLKNWKENPFVHRQEKKILLQGLLQSTEMSYSRKRAGFISSADRMQRLQFDMEETEHLLLCLCGWSEARKERLRWQSAACLLVLTSG